VAERSRRPRGTMSTTVSGEAHLRQGQHSAKPARVLVLSLVHPDFLAPIYSISRVLRDEGYLVDIFSFSSKAGGAVSLPVEITLHDCGVHAGSAMQRLAARRRFRTAVSEYVDAHAPDAIIASCPFSLLEAQRVAPNIPLVYFAFELYDPALGSLLRSPASRLRNWRALRAARNLAVVCTPSDERSDWLKNHAQLPVRPLTVLNAPYRGQNESTEDARRAARALLPASWHSRPVVIHTGNVTGTQAVAELVDSVQYWPAESCLLLTNVGQTDYAEEIRRSVAASPRAAKIMLVPLLPRGQMLELQRMATVGACFIRPGDNLESSMPAPNKVGEYLHAGLVIAGLDTPFMRMVAQRGAAVLAPSLDLASMGRAVSAALAQAAVPSMRERILDIASTWYSMEVQWHPVMQSLASLGAALSGEAAR